MKQIVISITVSILLFVCSLIVMIVGLTNKSKKQVLISIPIFIICIITLSYTLYIAVTKSYNKVTDTLRPRNGEEIYEALFDKPQFNCIRIINFSDQLIPKIDDAICLHFYTCADELKRILSQHDYKLSKLSTKSMNSNHPNTRNDWFKPENMGDTILIYSFDKDDYGNSQTIYSNISKTEVFIIDLQD